MPPLRQPYMPCLPLFPAILPSRNLRFLHILNSRTSRSHSITRISPSSLRNTPTCLMRNPSPSGRKIPSQVPPRVLSTTATMKTIRLCQQRQSLPLFGLRIVRRSLISYHRALISTLHLATSWIYSPSSPWLYTHLILHLRSKFSGRVSKTTSRILFVGRILPILGSCPWRHQHPPTHPRPLPAHGLMLSLQLSGVSLFCTLTVKTCS